MRRGTRGCLWSMPKNGDAGGSNGRKIAAGKHRSREGNRRPADGSRVGPGTVPRGSAYLPQGRIFSLLGRMILDRLDRGVILLDVRGKIVDANTEAVHVIRNCGGFALRAGKLGFTDAGLDAQLKRAISGGGPAQKGGRAVFAARVRCRGNAPYRVVIRPVPPGADERDVAYFALLYAPNGLHAISIDALREVYGLTQAQARVARSLFAGRSVEETARALGLSANTVRTHLKQIFTKCEVNSQAELLHLLALGPHEI